MLTTAYSDLLPEVLPHLGGDPSDPGAISAIRRAAIELCSASMVWSEALDPIALQAGEYAYDFDLGRDRMLLQVRSATVDGRELEPRAWDWLHGQLPGWQTQLDTPRYFTQQGTEQIALAPAPAGPGQLALLCALAPSPESTRMPAWIATQYRYAIADGALAVLMAMTNKPWSDPQGAAYRRQQFEAAIAAAQARAAEAFGLVSVRVTPHH